MGWLSNIGGYFTGGNQRNAANNAINTLQQSKDEAIGYYDKLSPWAKGGGQALSPLTGLLTGTSYDYATGNQTQLNPEQRNNLFTASPGYQFRLDQAMKALTSRQNALGYSNSGGADKELVQYSQGLASDEYNNYLNQLFQLAGVGYNADATMASGKANAALGIAAPMAQAAFSKGIAADVGANRMLNFGAQMAGAAMGVPQTGGASGGGAGAGSGGQYNPAFFNSSGKAFVGV
jgi:hypothetical protein